MTDKHETPAQPSAPATSRSRAEPRSADARTELAALLPRLVRRGNIYDLAHDLAAGMPSHPYHPPYAFSLAQRHGDLYREDGYSFANETIVLCGHHGTHIDAIGHVSRQDALYGGVSALATQRGRAGLTALGAEELPPFICRGILLDVARNRGVDEVAPAAAIGAEELASVAATQRSEIRPGDVVLIRTGWARRWQEATRFLSLDEGQPGPDREAAVWLADLGVRLTGSDTMVYEVLRPNQNAMPVHLVLLRDRGIPIMEMLQLEHLAAARQYEFLFIALPLKIRGATGSPLRPIALV